MKHACCSLRSLTSLNLHLLLLMTTLIHTRSLEKKRLLNLINVLHCVVLFRPCMSDSSSGWLNISIELYRAMSRSRSTMLRENLPVHWSLAFSISTVLKSLTTIGGLTSVDSLSTRLVLRLVLSNCVSIIAMKSCNNCSSLLFSNKNRRNTRARISLGNMSVKPVLRVEHFSKMMLLGWLLQ